MNIPQRVFPNNENNQCVSCNDKRRKNGHDNSDDESKHSLGFHKIRYELMGVQTVCDTDVGFHGIEDQFKTV